MLRLCINGFIMFVLGLAMAAASVFYLQTINFTLYLIGLSAGCLVALTGYVFYIIGIAKGK